MSDFERLQTRLAAELTEVNDTLAAWSENGQQAQRDMTERKDLT